MGVCLQVGPSPAQTYLKDTHVEDAGAPDAAQPGPWTLLSSKRDLPAPPWLVEVPDHDNAEVALTASFSDPTEIRATLVLAGERRRGKLWTGLGLRLRGRFAALVRYHRGRPKIIDRFRFRSFFNREQVEISLRLFGDTLLATARDPRLDLPLGAGLAREALIGRLRPTRPLVGVIPKARSKGALVSLTARPMCAHLPAPPSQPADPPIVLSVVDEGLESASYGEIVDRRRRKVVFRTDPDGLERHHCAGRTPGELVGYAPWRLRDLRFHQLGPERLPSLRRDPMQDPGYAGPAMVEAVVEGLAAGWPRHARRVSLGQSHEGRPISALLIADDVEAALDGHRIPILLNGGHHGNELLSVDFALDAARQLVQAAAQGPAASPRWRRWLRSYAIWVVPLLNPDGNAAYLQVSSGAGRKNRRDVDGDGRVAVKEGVDLNRNYPYQWGALGEKGSRSDPKSQYYRGEHPASEPETRALMALVERERFAASVSFHTGTVALLSPYTIEGVPNPSPDVAWGIAEAMAVAVGEHPQGRPLPVLRSLYAVDGVDQDWMMQRHGTLAFLVEGALWTPTDPQQRLDIVKAIRPTWQVLLDRLLDGPTLSGQVLDAAGRPVGAEVMIEEMRPQAEERWHARCRDGHFTRALPTPGRYTARISVPGRRAIRRTVDVKAHTTLNISLPYKVHPRCPPPGALDEQPQRTAPQAQ